MGKVVDKLIKLIKKIKFASTDDEILVLLRVCETVISVDIFM
jgi:hypothetical protein